MSVSSYNSKTSSGMSSSQACMYSRSLSMAASCSVSADQTRMQKDPGSPLAQLCPPCQSQLYARQSTWRTQHSAQRCFACCLLALLQPAYCREDHQKCLLNITSHTSICLAWSMLCPKAICTCCVCVQATDANTSASSCTSVQGLTQCG
jgi:hypothetical protein